MYLDNNATTRPTPRVIHAMTRALSESWENPSSTHRPGQRARSQVELARQSIADLIGGRAREITFTSGGTESIDLAIRGSIGAWITARRGVHTPRILTTAVEHSAVRDLCQELTKLGIADTATIKLLPDGIVDLDALAAQIDDHTALVSIQWANNETGIIQPVHAIHALCQSRGVIFHCDGVQWVGKMPCPALADTQPNVTTPTPTSITPPPHRHAHAPTIPCDLLSISPHKFHGPKGVGALWTATGVKLRPLMLGSQELGRRGGTENVPGIVGAGEAAIEAKEWLDSQVSSDTPPSLTHPITTIARGTQLRDDFESKVLSLCPSARVNTTTPHRLWNTTNIGFEGLEAEAILMALSEKGVYASAGAACSSGSLDPSPVLLAMGIEPAIAHGSIRFSISRYTTKDELDQAAQIVAMCINKLRRVLPR